jgi:hypothetical protein
MKTFLLMVSCVGKSTQSDPKTTMGPSRNEARGTTTVGPALRGVDPVAGVRLDRTETKIVNPADNKKPRVPGHRGCVTFKRVTCVFGGDRWT